MFYWSILILGIIISILSVHFRKNYYNEKYRINTNNLLYQIAARVSTFNSLLLIGSFPASIFVLFPFFSGLIPYTILKSISPLLALLDIVIIGFIYYLCYNLLSIDDFTFDYSDYVFFMLYLLGIVAWCVDLSKNLNIG